MNRHGVVLVPAHTSLKQEHIQKIINHGGDLRQLDIIQGEGSLDSAALIETMTEQIQQIFQFVRVNHQIPLMEIRKDIVPAIHQVSLNPNLFQLFNLLQSKDDYTYRHNIGVGVIATLLGKWLKLSDSEMSILTMGAILHDVGKMKVPDEILNKPDKLTHREYEMMKKHTLHGYTLIKETVGASHRIALIALQHHEREDGEGYPLQMKSAQIDFLSKIVAVADVFHAMSSNRVYHQALPLYQILSQMKSDVFGKFDPVIMTTFLHRVMDSLVGNEVLLTNGKKGTILMINPYSPERPVIQVEGEIIDLNMESSIGMKLIVS